MPDVGEPATSAPEAAPAASALRLEPKWRTKLRESRWATLGILGLTAAAVALGIWIANPALPGSTETNAGSVADGKVTAVNIGASTAPQLGKKPPDFRLSQVAGQPLGTEFLSQLRGKPVWVVFAATWCSGCRVEMPDIAAAAQKANVQVVVVYLGEDAAGVKAFQERTGLDLAAVADEDSRISASWGIMGIPAHFFLDSDGVLQSTRVGLLSPETISKNLAKIS